MKYLLIIAILLSGCDSPDEVIQTIKHEKELCEKNGGIYTGSFEHGMAVPYSSCRFKTKE